MDAKSRKKYPELRDPSTYGKEDCRIALKAMGHRNISRLKANGKDGKQMLQEFVSDDWKLKPKTRRISMRAVATSLGMAYETSDSEEEEKEEDNVVVLKPAPPRFAIKKLAGLIALKGEAEATKNTYMYAAGQKYLTADVLELLTPPELANARQGRSSSPPSKSAENKGKRAAVTQSKNGVVRLLNCLFMDDTRKYWEASKLQATRTRNQLDNQEVGSRLPFWEYVRDKVMDPETKVGALLPEPEGYNLLDGLDPAILDLPADTTGAHLKHMFEVQCRHYNAAKVNFEKSQLQCSRSHDQQFANFVGKEGPNMGGSCTAMMDEEAIEDCAGSDSDNVAPSLASSQNSSSSWSRKKAKTGTDAAIVNLAQGLSSGFANLGAGIAAMAAARSVNQDVDAERMQATNRAMMLSNMAKKHTMLHNLWDLSDSIVEKISGACDDRQEARLTKRLKSVEKQIKELDGST